eukprot:gene18386-19185_t
MGVRVRAAAFAEEALRDAAAKAVVRRDDEQQPRRGQHGRHRAGRRSHKDGGEHGGVLLRKSQAQKEGRKGDRREELHPVSPTCGDEVIPLCDRPEDESDHSYAPPPVSHYKLHTIMCKFHSQGICRRGSACQFRHGSDDGVSDDTAPDGIQAGVHQMRAVCGTTAGDGAVCEHWLRGACSRGSACPQRHLATTPAAAPADAPSAGTGRYDPL